MSLFSVASSAAGAAASAYTKSSRSVAVAGASVGRGASGVAATSARTVKSTAKPSGPSGVAAIANAWSGGASSKKSSPAVVKTISAAGKAAAAAGHKTSAKAQVKRGGHAAAAVAHRASTATKKHAAPATVAKASSAIALGQPSFKIAPSMNELRPDRSPSRVLDVDMSERDLGGLLGLVVVGGVLLGIGAVLKNSDTDEPAKKVPNPDGRKGGAEHQAGVRATEAELKAKHPKDVKVDTEVPVFTPDGEKGKRYLDAAARDRSKEVIEGVQVGRTTKAGNPVAREQRALDDIRRALPGAEIRFRSYEPTKRK